MQSMRLARQLNAHNLLSRKQVTSGAPQLHSMCNVLLTRFAGLRGLLQALDTPVASPTDRVGMLVIKLEWSGTK